MKAFKHLFHDEFNVIEGDALVVAANYELQQIMTEYFENHTNMRAVHTADFKVVQELDTPLTVGISLITFADLQSKQEFLSKKIMTAGMVCGNLNTVNPQKIVRLSFACLV